MSCAISSAAVVASDPKTVEHGAFGNSPDWLSRSRETRHLGAMVSGRAFARDDYQAALDVLDTAPGEGVPVARSEPPGWRPAKAAYSDRV
jgi:hypothetical protein